MPSVKHLAATLALGPFLMMQGRHVRRVTPVLPEPPGPREGVNGDGAPLRLLILGDSAAAGVGAATQTDALSGQLVAAISPHFQVSWRLHARTGATTSAMLRDLSATAAETYDVVVTSLGVNDLTAGRPRKVWLGQQTELITLLRSKLSARLILLSGMPPMHHFPALPQPLRWYMGEGARRYNRGLENLTEAFDDCHVVSIDASREAELLEADSIAADGFHPGPAFYTIWAESIAAQIINSPLATPRA